MASKGPTGNQTTAGSPPTQGAASPTGPPPYTSTGVPGGGTIYYLPPPGTGYYAPPPGTGYYPPPPGTGYYPPPPGTGPAPPGTASAPQGTASAPQGTASAPPGTGSPPPGTIYYPIPPGAVCYPPPDRVYAPPGPRSQVAMCPDCKMEVQTLVRYKPGDCTYAWCVILCFLQVWSFFCLHLIPFLISDAKDAHHYCPRCGRLLGIYKRSLKL